MTLPFKKFLSKKKKSLKGNISLLFIFILLASSTIVILAMTQIRHLMDYGTSAFDYFKTYYFAKAGLELALTEVQTRGYGFNFESTGGNAIITDNFDYESGLNYFAYTITGRHLSFQDTVATGEFLTLPLFYDTIGKQNSHAKNLSGEDKQITHYNFSNNIKEFKIEWDTTSALMSLLVYDTWMNQMQAIVQATGNQFQAFVNNTIDWCIGGSNDEKSNQCSTYSSEYLGNGNSDNFSSFIMIKNISDHGLTFSGSDTATNNKDWITLLKSKIIVIGHYHDDEISMEAEYAKPVPGFFGASIGSSS